MFQIIDRRRGHPRSRMIQMGSGDSDSVVLIRRSSISQGELTMKRSVPSHSVLPERTFPLGLCLRGCVFGILLRLAIVQKLVEYDLGNSPRTHRLQAGHSLNESWESPAQVNKS
jgi:hypothetical protein